MAIVHAEVEYTNKNGDSIHSDLCPADCRFENIDDDYRNILHKCLDEWLNNSNGTGMFYIANEANVELLNHIGEEKADG